MVNLDHSDEYSQIVSLEYNSSKEELLMVYPNPTIDELFISLIAPKHNSAELAIKDVLGRVIYQYHINLDQDF